MNNEIEAKFPDIDKDELRAKLKAAGAIQQYPERLMRRKVFNTGPNSFARVRDEGGNRIVMTYKNFIDASSIMGVKEVNLVVDNYDDAVNFMLGCGLPLKAEEESYRELWLLDGTEVTLDTWPWLPPYTEIEGHSEAEVWATAEKLGFKKEDAIFGGVDDIFHYHYGIDQEVIKTGTPHKSFDMEAPEWSKTRIH